MSPGTRGHGDVEAPNRDVADRPGRGQSLVEFALLLPALLLLVLIAVDFGRVYLGWINLQNMARIGANFAANNALQFADPLTHDATLALYTNQIGSDASATNCPLAPGQPAEPTYTDVDGDGNPIGPGDRAAVTLVCRFHVITPLIAFVVGSDLNVTTTSVFPVKSALTQTTSGGGGGGGGCLPPTAGINATPSTSGAAPLTVTFRDASGGGSPTGWEWHFLDSSTPPVDVFPASFAQDPGAVTFTTPGTYTVTLKASNACGFTTTNPGTTVTVGPNNPPPGCTVPDFNGVKFNSAQGLWGTPKPPGAGFSTTVQKGPGAPNGNFTIKSQSIVAGTTVPCTSTITVNNP